VSVSGHARVRERQEVTAMNDPIASARLAAVAAFFRSLAAWATEEAEHAARSPTSSPDWAILRVTAARSLLAGVIQLLDEQLKDWKSDKDKPLRGEYWE
jgi:hypothetical protein